MKISDTGLQLVAQFEGCRLTAYQDSVGVWTIGYGHTRGVRRGQTISKGQALEFLRQDIVTAEKQVMKYDSKYHWTQNQFDALVSFAFNVGNISQLTNNGTRSIAQISAKISAYNKAGGKVLRGLTARRNAERALFDKAGTQKATQPTAPAKNEAPKTSSGGIKKASLKSLQEALNTDGIRDSKGRKLSTDGVLGPNTEWALNNCILQSGSKGASVQWLQMHLNTIAGDIFAAEKLAPLSITGQFNNQTVRAVVAYQSHRGLKSDGIVGKKTLLQMVSE